MSKWIQKADIKKGALHKELGVKEDERIPQKKLKKAAEAKGKEGRRARLALELEKFHKE